MSVLIRSMEIPQKCGQCKLYHAEYPMHCTAVEGHRTVGAPYGMPRPDWCPLVEVPEEFGNLIDKSKLYERTAELESQALEQASKLARTDDTEEWRRWHTILNERTAFKHDVADAPVVIEGDN